METTRVDALNKILTNTLEYKEFLTKMANSNYDSETCKKLNEFAKVREKQGHGLLKIIANCGGKAQTTERQTDQHSVSWVDRPQQSSEEVLALLKALIRAERRSLQDYEGLLGTYNFDTESELLLKKHRSEADTTLQYLEVAKETVERSA